MHYEWMQLDERSKARADQSQASSDAAAGDDWGALITTWKKAWQLQNCHRLTKFSTKLWWILEYFKMTLIVFRAKYQFCHSTGFFRKFYRFFKQFYRILQKKLNCVFFGQRNFTRNSITCPNLSYLDSLMPKWANFSIKLQFQEREKNFWHMHNILFFFKFWHCFLFTTTFTLGSF